MTKREAERKKLEGTFEDFFENGYAKGYFFKVHNAFADQLDIAITSKGATMGNCFAFETGDIFYDNADAYSLPWNEAVKKTGRAVCIEDSVPSSIITEETPDGAGVLKKKKYVLDGTLKFSLHEKSASGELTFSAPKIFETTQCGFEKFLRTGDIGVLEKTP